MTAIAVVVLVAALGVAARDLRRRRSTLDAALWPWMVDEVEAKVRGGQAPPVAVIGVALHGPPALRAAAGAAQRVWSAGGDADAALTELRRRVADPRVARLCETVAAVHAFDGDGTAALAGLRAAADRDARRQCALERQRSAVRGAAWLGLAPVAAVASEHLRAGVAVVALVAAAGAWLGVVATRARS